MVTFASKSIVFLLGAIVCVLSVWGIYAPDRLTKLVKGVVDKDWGLYFAVVGRLLLGAALILAAPATRFPVIFEVVGWIAIVAAVGIIFIGRKRLALLLARFER